MKRVAIIAGEPSGDLVGEGLIRELQSASVVPLQFMGIGGDKMKSTGFNSSFDMSILSIMGFGFDLLFRIPKILWIRQRIIKDILKFKPDVFIGIDAPDFNFYVERKLRRHGIKTVHYVSPSIWAWRYSRIYAIKKSTDLMICLFPMEEAIYAKENIKATYIGHPLAQSIPFTIDTKLRKNELMTLTGMTLNGPIFTVLVGSREGEVRAMAGLFISAASLIYQQIPNATFIFPLINERLTNLFTSITKNHNLQFPYKVLANQTRLAIEAADMVLSKSGTVTLEVALCKKPMIVSYKVSKFTEWIVSSRVTTKFASLPNIILNEELVPELIQGNATAQSLACKFIELYNDNSRRAYIDKRYMELHKLLQGGGVQLAAKTILANNGVNHRY